MTVMYALVVACMVGAPEPMGCVAVGDRFGPYRTELACKTRLRDMRKLVIPRLAINFKGKEFSYKEECNTIYGHKFNFPWIASPHALNKLFGESLNEDKEKPQG